MLTMGVPIGCGNGFKMGIVVSMLQPNAITKDNRSNRASSHITFVDDNARVPRLQRTKMEDEFHR
jgi:hypothetical protein